MGTTRITIEVAGYKWLIYGTKSKIRWQTHLVELLGEERLDVPVNRALMRGIQKAIAGALGLEVENVHPIPVDLILA